MGFSSLISAPLISASISGLISTLGWRRRLTGLLCLLIWILPAAEALAQPNTIQPYIDRVAEQISEFTLSNGMKVIVMERHQSPTVSFMTYVDVGSAYEQPNKTGAAHFLEHLAFKGTTQIGTQNYQAERPLLDELDALMGQLKTAGKATGLDALQQKFDQTQAKAAAYVNQNEFGQIVQQAGGVGLNATTTADATRYFYSFPANKLELWMSLESERFLDPVFREFFEEKAVIFRRAADAYRQFADWQAGRSIFAGGIARSSLWPPGDWL